MRQAILLPNGGVSVCFFISFGVRLASLVEKANVSRSHISSIEAPGIARPFSLEVFFNIADALEIDPADLINASVFPDKIIRGSK